MFSSCGFIAQMDINLLKYKDIVKYKMTTHVACIIDINFFLQNGYLAINNFFMAYTFKVNRCNIWNLLQQKSSVA